MSKMQVTIDDNDLDNGTWRTIDGEIGESVGSDDHAFYVANFQIEADDAEELMIRVKETRDEFNTKGVQVFISLDDTSTQYYAEPAVGDGTYTDVRSFIQPHPAHKQTNFRYRMQLVVEAIQVISSPGAGGGGSGVLANVGGGLRFNKQFYASRVESRSFQATFVSNFDGVANGPYTIASVEDDGGGLAVFVLSTTPVAFAANQKIKVSGSTNYNGDHTITAIDTGTKKVTTTIPFGATDVGTAYIGELTSATANYEAQRDTIMTTYLDTLADGERGATGLTLIVEQLEEVEDGSATNVFLQSSRMKYTANVTGQRKFDMKIETEDVQQWSKASGAGARPAIHTVSGTFEMDEAQRTISLSQVWVTAVKAAVETAIKVENGGETIKPIAIRYAVTTAGLLEFSCIYQSKNILVLHYKRSVSYRVDPDYVKMGGADGYHHVQKPSTPPPTFATVTVTRVGIGNVELDVEAPDIKGLTPIPAGSAESEEDVSANFSSDVWIQTKSQAYEYVRFKDGAEVDVTQVFTQGGR